MPSEEGKCRFCGAVKTYIKTPYVARVTHEPQYTFCCKAQEANNSYYEEKARGISSDRTRVPDPEEIEKW